MNVIHTAKERAKKNLVLFITVILIGLLFVFIFGANVPIEASFEAMVVFGTTVLPILLPFSTLLLLVNYTAKEISWTKKKYLNKFFNYLFVITAGYPTGTKTALLLSKNEAPNSACIKLALSTSITSPMVIINCVGRLTFNDAIFGVIMFLSQLVSSKIAVDLFTNAKMPDYDFTIPKTQLEMALRENLISVLTSATLTLLFYTTAKIFVDYTLANFKNPLFIGIISGFFETNYAMRWFSLIISPLSISLANFTLILGGAPLLLQTLVICRKLKMRTVQVVKFKLLQSALCFVLTYFFIFVFFFLTL